MGGWVPFLCMDKVGELQIDHSIRDLKWISQDLEYLLILYKILHK